MAIFFEIIKFIFFAMSIVVGLLLTKGADVLSSDLYGLGQQILVPGYLVFCGLMIGYIVTQLTMPSFIADEEQEKRIYAKGFMIGLGIGFIIALIYVFF